MPALKLASIAYSPPRFPRVLALTGPDAPSQSMLPESDPETTADLREDHQPPENDEPPNIEELRQIENELPKGSYDDDDDPRNYLQTIRKVALLTKESELAKRIKEDGPDNITARDALVKANLRLVVPIAKRYKNKGLSFSDLIQEGNLGLIRAAEKHDHTLGEFANYAPWWIKQSITRALADKSRTIRVPVHMVQGMHKLNKANARLSVDRELTTKDELAGKLAGEMGVSVEKVREFATASKTTTSLTTPDDTRSEDILEDLKAKQPLDLVTQRFLKSDIEQVLKSLTPREREVITMRFGLDDKGKRKVTEIAKIFGVTTTRIRQNIRAAIEKLRRPNSSKQLKGYLG